MTALEILELQEEIIRLQARAITELYKALAQAVTVAEADKLPCVRDIREAARLHDGIRPYTPRAPTQGAGAQGVKG